MRPTWTQRLVELSAKRARGCPELAEGAPAPHRFPPASQPIPSSLGHRVARRGAETGACRPSSWPSSWGPDRGPSTRRPGSGSGAGRRADRGQDRARSRQKHVRTPPEPVTSSSAGRWFSLHALCGQRRKARGFRESKRYSRSLFSPETAANASAGMGEALGRSFCCPGDQRQQSGVSWFLILCRICPLPP
jgi:hypothetical protein